VKKAAAIATVRRSVAILFFMVFQTSLPSGEGKGETATDLRNRDDFSRSGSRLLVRRPF
jgi:hypothetical protein